MINGIKDRMNVTKLIEFRKSEDLLPVYLSCFKFSVSLFFCLPHAHKVYYSKEEHAAIDSGSRNPFANNLKPTIAAM